MYLKNTFLYWPVLGWTTPFRSFPFLGYFCLSIYGSIVLVDLGRFFSFLIYTQSVEVLVRGISPSQGRYPHTEQNKHRINAHTDIHVLSGIRTHDPSARTSEDSSCLRRRGHCDRHFCLYLGKFSYSANLKWNMNIVLR
jgi:hypothetical protein